MASSPLVLLGPQRLRPTLVAVFDRLGVTRPVAAVTAGWQEREGEVEELSEHLERPVDNLQLHARSEAVFAADPELAAAYRERQERLRRLQEIYRQRLGHALRAARQMMAADGDDWLLEPERSAALTAIRRLDGHHLRRLRQVHTDFEAQIEVHRRPAVARHRDELAERLEAAGALAIAGGHVAVLLNRLRLFGVLELARRLPVIAWSAGAMVLADRVVLFHDSPPQGAGNAEVLESGLAVARGVLPLPHAHRRLRLSDPTRVAIFARRFAPLAAIALDDGSRLTRRGDGRWRAGPGTHRLTRRGAVEQLEEAL